MLIQYEFTLALAMALYILSPEGHFLTTGNNMGQKISLEKVSGATTIDAAQARQLFDRGVLFIDIRKDKDWDAGRVPDAKQLELTQDFTHESLAALSPPDKDVVFYCNGVDCVRSAKASILAVGWGYSKVHYFRLGFPSWKNAGHPAE